MEGMIGEIRAVAEGIFLSGDWTYIGMVAGALLIGVLAMKNFGQILCVSLLAMVMLAIIWIVYGGATSAAPSDAATWTTLLEDGWATVSASTGSTLVGYLITFAVAIGVLFIGKSLIFRG